MALPAVHHTPKLERLLLEETVPDGAAAVGSLPLDKTPELLELNLRVNKLGDGLADLQLDKTPKLQLLDVAHNSLGPTGVRGLQLECVPNLHTLAMDYNDLGPAGACALAFDKLPKLQALHLGANGLTSQGAMDLRLGAACNLRALHLNNNNIGPEGVSAIPFPVANTITTLNLSANPIMDAGSLPLAQVPDLRELWLVVCRLRGDRMHALRLEDTPKLEMLQLDSNLIDGAGVQALVLALDWVPLLRHLSLAYNDVDDAAPRALRLDRAPSLRRLSIGSNYISDEVVQEWKQQFPQLRVTGWPLPPKRIVRAPPPIVWRDVS